MAVLLALAPVLAQDGAELLSESAGGLLDLQGESRLEIGNLRGTVSIRAGKPGELQFMCRSLDNRREEQPVALWVEGRTFRLQAVEGQEDLPRLVEVAVPPELTVDIRLEESRLAVTGLHSPLNVGGRAVQFEGRGLMEPVTVDLAGGVVKLTGVDAEVTVEGSDLELKLVEVGGFVSLVLVNSTAFVQEIVAEAEFDLDATELRAKGIHGRVQATAHGGTVDLEGLGRGGLVESQEAPLTVKQSRGNLEVQTDAPVEVRDLRGDLQVDSLGASIVAVGVSGGVNLRNVDSEIKLENIGGAALIDGDALQIHIKQVKGDLTLSARSSNATIEGTEGTVDISCDYGDVNLSQATGSVQIVSSDGSVHITELNGPLQLKANGPEVDVSWKGFARDQNIVVENEGGSVTLSFPPQAGGKLDARTRYGSIESKVRGVEVAEDGTTATGMLRRMNQPTIQVDAGGDIYLRYYTPTPKSP